MVSDDIVLIGLCWSRSIWVRSLAICSATASTLQGSSDMCPDPLLLACREQVRDRGLEADRDTEKGGTVREGDSERKRERQRGRQRERERERERECVNPNSWVSNIVSPVRTNSNAGV